MTISIITIDTAYCYANVILLCIFLLNFVMLSVVFIHAVQSVIMLSVDMPSVVMLNVVAPFFSGENAKCRLYAYSIKPFTTVTNIAIL